MSSTAINSFFAQREAEKAQKTQGEAKKFLTKDEKKRKYFAPKAEEENFRVIVPTGGLPYETAYFHDLSTDGGMPQQYYCLQHNDGKPCPICEKRAALKAESNALPFGSPEAKAKFKESNAYEPRKYYIIKGISRGHLSDGIKFWRFKENFKKEGAMDLIEAEIAEWDGDNPGIDFADPFRGADLKIKTIEKNKTVGTGTYRAIQSIRFTKAKPLADDDATIAKLVGDTMSWKEIYTPIAINGHLNEYEFLRAVLDGRAPEWDKDQKKWIITRENGETYAAEYARPGAQGGEASAPAPAPAPVAEAPAPVKTTAAPKKATKAPVVADDDNDLPF